MSSKEKKSKTLLKLALKFMHNENYKRALKKCDRAIVMNQENSQAHLMRGDILFQLDKHEESARSYESAIKIDPNSAIYYQKYAQVLLLMNKAEKGLKMINKALEFEEDEKIILLKCSILYDLKRFKECLKICRKKMHIMFYEFHGMCLSELGDNEQALPYLQHTIETSSNKAFNNETIAMSLVKCLMNVEKYQDALVFLEEIIHKANDTQSHSWNLDLLQQDYATCLKHLGKFKDAREKFIELKCADISQCDADTFESAFRISLLDFNIAMCEIGLKKFCSALQIFDDICSNPPHYKIESAALHGRSLAKLHLQDLEESLKDLQLSRVLHFFPKRRCEGCGLEKWSQKHFQTCACRLPSYCGYECQKIHWNVHKLECKKLGKNAKTKT